MCFPAGPTDDRAAKMCRQTTACRLDSFEREAAECSFYPGRNVLLPATAVTCIVVCTVHIAGGAAIYKSVWLIGIVIHRWEGLQTVSRNAHTCSSGAMKAAKAASRH